MIFVGCCCVVLIGSSPSIDEGIVVIQADRHELRLSESVTLTLTIEAAETAIVELPKLDATTTDAVVPPLWTIHTLGPLKEETITPGRRRWVQLYRARPNTAGEPLKLQFPIVGVRNHSDDVPRQFQPESLEFRVLAVPETALPRGPLEPLPIHPKRADDRTPWPVILGAFGSLMSGTVMLFLILRKPKPTVDTVSKPELSTEDYVNELYPSATFAASLRCWIYQELGHASISKSTPEVLTEFTAKFQESKRESIGRVLALCDEAQYGGKELAQAERAGMWAAAKQILARD